ncbi:hypothetical protein WDH52_06745 [Streptomyces sp. TRM70308]|uniref:hypothetical protein n=1 Tax=Streptomyces sp. TRM70308 TaxID=3131932 RepID=UPI003D00FB30
MDGRWRTGAAAGLLLLAGVTACAGRAGEGGESGARVERLDAGQLRLAVLSLADLPAGWVSDSDTAARERGTGVPRPPRGPCREVFRDARGGAEARARFARTEVGPFLVTRAGSHPSAADAADAVAAFRAAVRQCPGFRLVGHSDAAGPDAAGPARFRAEPVRDPGLGQESAAARFVRGGFGGEPDTVAEVVYVRVGAHTVHLARSGHADHGSPAHADLTRLARTAVAKLREVASGRTPEPAESFPGATRL